MSDIVVSKRYAEALFQLGKEKGILDELRDQSLLVKKVFDENKELATFLTHPKVDLQSKKDFVAKAFASLQTELVNALKLLIDRNRIANVPDIADELVQLVNEENGIADATVYSVRQLTDAEKQQLSKSFSKHLNKKEIKINNVVDPSVIGGVKIRVGNTIYDGTISGKLHRIEQQIMTANK